jgi:hypothetical protein
MVRMWALPICVLFLAAGTTFGHGQFVSGVVGAYAGGGPSQGLTNLPYSATTVQKLANGATITRTTTSNEARDSQGRTMRESKPALIGDVPQGVDFTRVTVMDPVAHNLISWGMQMKQATLIHLPEPGQQRPVSRAPAQPVVAGPAGTEGSVTPVLRRTFSQPGKRPEIRTEKLAGKFVGSVYAEGIRTTRTIPTGMEGNDQPLVTVSETWTSPDLKLIVLSTVDDPRTGLRTEELTDLSRNEPNRSLFQVPAGYTVKEQGTNQP